MTSTQSARDRMLQSAAVLQRQRGVAGVSFADVLAHSGTSRGSVYHHFPQGREQLAAEATASAADLMVEALRHGLDAGEPVAAIGAFLDGWFASMTVNGQDLGCPLAAGALDEPGTTTRAAAGVGFAALTSAISGSLTDRGVAAAEADTLATVGLAAVEGALILARAGDDEAMPRVRDFLLAQLAAALARAASGGGAAATD